MFLDPHSVSEVDGVLIVVDRHRPVAAFVRPGQPVRFAVWPDAPLPQFGTEVSVIPAPAALWVIYTEFETPETTGPSRSTAVCIEVDGAATGVDLNGLRAIGADDVGLWCAVLPSLSADKTQPERERFDPEELRASEGAPLEEPEDLPTPVGVDIRTSSGWSRGRRGPEVQINDPQPTGPMHIHRVRSNGTTDEFVVDRAVAGVEIVNGWLRLTYHPTGPLQFSDNGGDSVSYRYPIATIELPRGVVTAGSSLQVADYKGTPGMWDPLRNWADRSPTGAEYSRIDISNVEGVDWTPRRPAGDLVAKSVENVRQQLTSLGKPRRVWTSADNRVHIVRSDYRDLSVTVEGDWPGIEVIAEFSYHPRDDQLFRFRVPVFDASGAFAVSEYFTIHLEEDLDTMALDEPERLVDGFIKLGLQTT